MNPELEIIADYACETGECPVWHPMEQAVYWTDIPQGRLFRYDPATGEHRQVYQGRPVGGMTVQEDGKLLLFMDRGTVALFNPTSTRSGVGINSPPTLEYVIEELPQEHETRFNDVIADPLGGVFCGTMRRGDTPGRLYRLHPNGEIEMLLEGTKTSNGMGFSPDLRKFYFTDSGPATVWAFDFDPDTAKISNPEVIIHVDRSVEGATDGMTVDTEGNIWSARWDGSRLVKHAPNGQELLVIPFPVKKVSSCTFGGPDYTDLYVTTAGGTDKPANGESAGSLFRLRPGPTGRPEFLSKVAPAK